MSDETPKKARNPVDNSNPRRKSGWQDGYTFCRLLVSDLYLADQYLLHVLRLQGACRKYTPLLIAQLRMLRNKIGYFLTNMGESEEWGPLDVLITEGETAFNMGRYPTAAKKLEAAHRLIYVYCGDKRLLVPIEISGQSSGAEKF